MRKITTLLFLLLSMTLFSQEIEVIQKKIKINDGIQKGTLVYNGTKYVANGIWKSDYTRAEYDMGKLVWIQPKGDKRYTYSYIEMEQLRRKVQRLETRLASNDKP
jgi:hypothetical protein